MDAQRKEVIEGLAKVLKKSKRAGVVYLAPDGRRADSHYAWPWPSDEGERALTLELILEQLDKVSGVWRLVYCEEGEPVRRGYTTLWPDRSGLFDPPKNNAAGKVQELIRLPEQTLVEQRDRLSEGCAEDILKLLEDVGRRLTIMEILDEFATREIPWSSTTVSHTAPAMRRAGRLSNRQRGDDHGRGYGLPDWGED